MLDHSRRPIGDSTTERFRRRMNSSTPSARSSSAIAVETVDCETSNRAAAVVMLCARATAWK